MTNNTFQLDAEFVGVSISWGTLRLCDLLSAGLEFMSDHDPIGLAALNEEWLPIINSGLWSIYLDYPLDFNDGSQYGQHVHNINTLLDLGGLSDTHPVWDYDRSDLDWLWCEAVYDRLNDIAPNYCHFGSHEGDGADIGFWVSWDSLHDDLKYAIWDYRLPAVVLEWFVADWQNWDFIADFLESLDHENLPAFDKLRDLYALQVLQFRGGLLGRLAGWLS